MVKLVNGMYMLFVLSQIKWYLQQDGQLTGRIHQQHQLQLTVLSNKYVTVTYNVTTVTIEPTMSTAVMFSASFTGPSYQHC
jgi:hypothetical protein